MIATLPSPPFELPEWTQEQFVALRRAEQQLATVRQHAGTSSARFKHTCQRFEQLAQRGQAALMGDHIVEPIDARAFTYLLADVDAFAARIALTRPLLARLQQVRSPMSRLSLLQMIRAYFLRFDAVADAAALDAWGALITSELDQIGQRRGASELTIFSQYRHLLFAPDGPARLVAHARAAGVDFDSLLVNYGLSGFRGGRYIKQCLYQYYLAQLDALPVGSSDPLLTEICKPDVYNVPYTGGRLLGHAILEKLIDRTGSAPISAAWQKAVLSIAGDPRMPHSNPRFQQWWVLLGDKRIAMMRGWLSRFDLKLFLEVLEQSAKDSGKKDMERMYGSRKVFMEGLLEQGLVTESRLFLDGNSEYYLNRRYKRGDLPDFARVSGSQCAIIYLCLNGRVHLLEGSHNFKLKLVDRLPKRCQITDYGVGNFGFEDLRALGLDYIKEFRSPSGKVELTHDVHLNWQHNAIKYLQAKGVAVQASQLISPQRYRQYKEKFGAA